MSQTELARALRCLTAGPAPHVSEAAFRAVRECGDLTELAEIAVAQRVAPWVSAALASAEVEFTNAPAVRSAGSRQAIETFRLFGELTKLLTQLNAESIPTVVLKGPVLAETYYPEPSLRPYGDIDLLIHEPDLARVSSLLFARGYRLKDEHEEGHRLHECHGLFQSIFVHPDEGFVVEVHCDHLQIGLEPVSMDVIWNTAEERRFGRGSARTLEANDTFVHLCVHLQRHGFARLIWWKDIDLMVRSGDVDWAAVRAKAEEQGCLDSVSYCLWLLPKMLGTPLPEPAVRLSRAQGRLSRLVFRQSWPLARIQRVERTGLPLRRLGGDRVGDGADQVGRNLGAVDLAQVALDLTRAQAARVERNDLVVEAGQPALILADQHRVETGLTVARYGHIDMAVVGQYTLAAAAVAVVAAGAGGFLLRQVVVELGRHQPVQQGLLEFPQ